MAQPELRRDQPLVDIQGGMTRSAFIVRGAMATTAALGASAAGGFAPAPDGSFERPQGMQQVLAQAKPYLR